MQVIPKHAGFTLFEMLVVLVIVALISTLFMTRITTRPKATAPKVIQFLNDERSNALKRQKPTYIQLRRDSLYSTLTQHSYQFAGNLNDVFSGNDQSLPYKTLTVFFPDGTMTANDFTLTEGSTIYAISTSPFSNKIRFKLQ
ncbi:pilus assembly FimT family protein [Methylomarinum vadi]|uniref:pilus assembly FimT family protein n=1 Tax=Methylomarinum vadi TaxID=438855 RepID=UPI0004DF1F97|nr:prepilin-type N-terminal cleavage/methylation domain-containing protein [Methylomarinum vadi]